VCACVYTRVRVCACARVRVCVCTCVRVCVSYQLSVNFQSGILTDQYMGKLKPPVYFLCNLRYNRRPFFFVFDDVT
jgi:hypothetical protein